MELQKLVKTLAKTPALEGAKTHGHTLRYVLVEAVLNTLLHTVTEMEVEAPLHTLADPLAEAKVETLSDTLSYMVA